MNFPLLVLTMSYKRQPRYCNQRKALINIQFNAIKSDGDNEPSTRPRIRTIETIIKVNDADHSGEIDHEYWEF